MSPTFPDDFEMKYCIIKSVSCLPHFLYINVYSIYDSAKVISQDHGLRYAPIYHFLIIFLVFTMPYFIMLLTTP